MRFKFPKSAQTSMLLAADNISFGVSCERYLDMVTLLDGGVELLVESSRVLSFRARWGSLGTWEIRGSAKRVVLTKQV